MVETPDQGNLLETMEESTNEDKETAEAELTRMDSV